MLSQPILVLSPHADDAVLSCGGLLAQHADALVVTACAGDLEVQRPAALASLAPPALRREEDARAMAILKCAHRELSIPDAIDRVGEDGQRLYKRPNSLFGPVLPADAGRCAEIVEALEPLLEGRTLLAPLGVGAHVDHQLAAHAGRRLAGRGQDTWFYEDAPYVFPDPGPALPGDSALKAALRMRAQIVGVQDEEIDIEAKEKVLECYSSQIAALFGDMARYSALAAAHYEELGGALERYYKLRFR